MEQFVILLLGITFIIIVLKWGSLFPSTRDIETYISNKLTEKLAKTNIEFKSLNGHPYTKSVSVRLTPDTFSRIHVHIPGYDYECQLVLKVKNRVFAAIEYGTLFDAGRIQMQPKYDWENSEVTVKSTVDFEIKRIDEYDTDTIGYVLKWENQND